MTNWFKQTYIISIFNCNLQIKKLKQTIAISIQQLNNSKFPNFQIPNSATKQLMNYTTPNFQIPIFNNLLKNIISIQQEAKFKNLECWKLT